jgi:hypothetical protein
VAPEGGGGLVPVQKLAVQGITREGVQYQAQVPAEPIAMHPIGREENDPRAALAMLSAAEALVSVMGRELASTRKLPPDATHDLELLPPGAHCFISVREGEITRNMCSASYIEEQDRVLRIIFLGYALLLHCSLLQQVLAVSRTNADAIGGSMREGVARCVGWQPATWW